MIGLIVLITQVPPRYSVEVHRVIVQPLTQLFVIHDFFNRKSHALSSWSDRARALSMTGPTYSKPAVSLSTAMVAPSASRSIMPPPLLRDASLWLFHLGERVQWPTTPGWLVVIMARNPSA